MMALEMYSGVETFVEVTPIRINLSNLVEVGETVDAAAESARIMAETDSARITAEEDSVRITALAA